MVADEFISQQIKQARMRFQDACKSDLKDVLENYKELSISVKMFVSPEGKRMNTINLAGTLPIDYKGNTYNIPVALWLMDNHPYSAPYCYVTPTDSMKIRVSEHVDDKGRIFLPYLNEWRFPGYDTIGLLGVLTFTFQENCPVFSVSKKKSTDSNRASNPPYPASGMPVPYPVAQTGFPMPGNSQHYPSFPMPNAGNSEFGGYRAPYPPYPTPGLPSRGNPPPVPMPPQHSYANGIRASLLTAVEERLSSKLKVKLGKTIEETQWLEICLNEMRTGQKQLRESLSRADEEQRQLELSLSVYNERKREFSDALEKYSAKDADSNIDNCVNPVTPLHRQIFDNYVLDLTMDDVIYHLTASMRNRTMSLQQFLTLVRACARKKFIAIATMNKARDVAKLPKVTQ